MAHNLLPYANGLNWLETDEQPSFPNSNQVSDPNRNLATETYSAPALNVYTGERGAAAGNSEGPRVMRPYGTYLWAPYLVRGGNLTPFNSRIQRFDGAGHPQDIIPPNGMEIQPMDLMG